MANLHNFGLILALCLGLIVQCQGISKKIRQVSPSLRERVSPSFNVQNTVKALRRVMVEHLSPDRGQLVFQASDRAVESSLNEQNARSIFGNNLNTEFVDSENMAKAAMYTESQASKFVLSTGLNASICFGANGNPLTRDVAQVTNEAIISQIGLCPFDKANTLPCTSQFREPTGRCSNVEEGRRTWGMAGTPFARILPNRYEDGISQHRTTEFSSSSPAKSARKISETVTSTVILLHQDFSAQLMQWGQFIAHEFTLIGEIKKNVECCPDKIFRDIFGDNTEPTAAQLEAIRQEIRELRGHICIPIENENDSVYGGHVCMQQTRSIMAPNHDCSAGPRQQANTITHFMDASAVYGSSKQEESRLRSFTDGKMKVQTVNGHTLPPPDTRNCPAQGTGSGGSWSQSGSGSWSPSSSGSWSPPSSGSWSQPAGSGSWSQPGLQSGSEPLPHILSQPWARIRRAIWPGSGSGSGSGSQSRCPFLGGDGRINTTPNLASMHTAFLVLHNKFVDRLKMINPHWDPERLYQETRRIIGGIQSSIHYNEFLPIILGEDLYSQWIDNYDGYDSEVNPSVLNELAGAAHRFGHSIIDGIFFTVDDDENVEFNGLVENFFNHDIVYERGAAQHLRGLQIIAPWKVDNHFPAEMRDRLFNQQKDIVSFNINRGRDHGFASYMDYRRHYGLFAPSSWDELKQTHPEHVVESLRQVYTTVEDIELYIGGVTEKPMSTGIVGDLFGNIMGDGFSRIRNGDRLFYASSESGLTEDQIQAIDDYTLAQLLCEGGEITTTSRNAFFQPTSSLSESVSCSALAPFNLDLWQDDNTNTCEWQVVEISKCCNGEKTITRQCVGQSPSCQCAGSAIITESCSCPSFDFICILQNELCNVNILGFQ